MLIIPKIIEEKLKQFLGCNLKQEDYQYVKVLVQTGEGHFEPFDLENMEDVSVLLNQVNDIVDARWKTVDDLVLKQTPTCDGSDCDGSDCDGSDCTGPTPDGPTPEVTKDEPRTDWATQPLEAKIDMTIDPAKTSQ